MLSNSYFRIFTALFVLLIGDGGGICIVGTIVRRLLSGAYRSFYRHSDGWTKKLIEF